MPRLETLKDNAGEIVYPRTLDNLVVHNGGSVQSWQEGLDKQIVAGEAVLGKKIAMSDTLPLWSGIQVSNPNGHLDTGTYSFITKRGQSLTCLIGNGGTWFNISAGGENINLFRQSWAATFSPSVTADYGMGDIRSGTNLYTRMYGKENNGSATNVGETTSTPEGPSTDLGVYFASMTATSGTKASTACEIVGVRLYPGANAWRIFGKIGSAGTLTTLSFESEVSTQNTAHIPTVYQRGATTSNVTRVYNYIEVLEVS